MLLNIDMFKTSNLFESGADEDSEVLSTMAAIAAEAMEQVMLRTVSAIYFGMTNYSVAKDRNPRYLVKFCRSLLQLLDKT